MHRRHPFGHDATLIFPLIKPNFLETFILSKFTAQLIRKVTIHKSDTNAAALYIPTYILYICAHKQTTISQFPKEICICLYVSAHKPEGKTVNVLHSLRSCDRAIEFTSPPRRGKVARESASLYKCMYMITRSGFTINQALRVNLSLFHSKDFSFYVYTLADVIDRVNVTLR